MQGTFFVTYVTFLIYTQQFKIIIVNKVIIWFHCDRGFAKSNAMKIIE